MYLINPILTLTEKYNNQGKVYKNLHFCHSFSVGSVNFFYSAKEMYAFMDKNPLVKGNWRREKIYRLYSLQNDGSFKLVNRKAWPK